MFVKHHSKAISRLVVALVCHCHVFHEYLGFLEWIERKPYMVISFGVSMVVETELESYENVN